jgi:4-hydroxy-2-oxoheptanedioate aldolase
LHAVNFECDPATYYARANDEILVVLMAEHVRAIEHADEIFSVPGIDAVFIGPNDLHHSMGRPPAFESDHQEFKDALAHVLQVCKKHGLAPGIHVVDEVAAKRRMAEGFQFIAVGSEAGMMLSKAQEIARAVGVGSSKAAVARY